MDGFGNRAGGRRRNVCNKHCFHGYYALVSFRSWEKRFASSNRNSRRYIRIVANNEPGIITNITSYLSENDIKVKTMNVKNNSQKNEVILELYLKIGRETDKEGFARGLQRISGIITVENLS